MTKTIVSILCISAGSFAVNLMMKDGATVSGYPICETKTTVVLKDGSEKITLFKKTIARVDTLSLEGMREFMFGDSAILKEKNDLLIVNSSTDSCTIRIRRSPEGTRLLERSAGPGDTIAIALTDGSFFETVRFWRKDGEYFSVGQPFTFQTKCSEFIRHEIELKGFLGETIPSLKGPKIAHERE